MNIIDNVFTIVELQIFIICVNMLSWPWALLICKAQIIFKISLSRMSIAGIVTSLKQFVSMVIDIIFSRHTLLSKV